MKNRTKSVIAIFAKIKIDIFIQKYHSLQISVILENKMGMKLELIVEVAVLRVVVGITVIILSTIVF